MSDRGSSFFDGLFIGSLIGGVLGVLFTPFTGEEARNKAKELIDKTGLTSGQAADDLRENSQEMISKAVDSIEQGILKLTQAVEEGKKAADEKRTELEGK